VSREEIVIARYQEDVSWAEGRPAIVYNKGLAVQTKARQVFLPNIGREAHTYLHHIINSWNDLAETTFFTQGGLDHVPPGLRLEQFFDPVPDIVVPRLVRCREWRADGRIDHFGIWKEKMDRGRMMAGRLSLVEWFRIYLDLDLEALGHILYAPGAIIAVKKPCILRRSLAFYQRLFETVAHHNDPEEAHYLERAWLYVFGSPGAKVRFLSA
jgi:hypothetical protein